MKPTFAVLVVDTDAAALAGLVDLLRGAGYKATGAPTFETARGLLETAVFDLLMTEQRLMTHNGLHLVVRSQVLQRAPAAIVLSSVPSSVDEAEARRLARGGGAGADRNLTARAGDSARCAGLADAAESGIGQTRATDSGDAFGGGGAGAADCLRERRDAGAGAE